MYQTESRSGFSLDCSCLTSTYGCARYLQNPEKRATGVLICCRDVQFDQTNDQTGQIICKSAAHKRILSGGSLGRGRPYNSKKVIPQPVTALS
jgi:hypothetical protein